jgi:4-amino-4-deoxy-L-arabinose transferase-like glycosyltransferase
LVVAAFFVAGGAVDWCRDAGIWIAEWRTAWERGNPVFQAARLLLVILGILGFIRALAPPWDPDGLIYHLQAPKLFLEQGFVGFLTGSDPANYPILPEMVFLIGLIWKCDVLAKILHLFFFYLLIGATFSFAKRFVDLRTARFSVVVLLSMPIMPFWATLAHSDFCWAAFQFMAFYALLAYLNDRQWAWLMIACCCAGYAMSSKYFALGGIAILFLWFLWRLRGEWKKSLPIIISFCLGAAVIACPWYLKNLLASGDPLYPIAIGVPIWMTEAQWSWQEYMRLGFGTGRTIWDYLLLPWNIYFHHERFATVGGTIEIPGFLFPFALVGILVRKAPGLRALGTVSVAWFVFWALGSQQIRFLLPLIPAVCVLSAAGMTRVFDRLSGRWIWRTLGTGIIIGFMAVTVLYQGMDTLAARPWNTLLGLESKEDYLQRMVTDYAAVRFALENVQPPSKVYLLWDSRGYYCNSQCIVDVTNYQWTTLVHDDPSPGAVARKLSALGASYLLVSKSDIAFLLLHDPSGEQERAWQYLNEQFLPECGRQIYQDEWSSIVEITCRDG